MRRGRTDKQTMNETMHRIKVCGRDLIHSDSERFFGGSSSVTPYATHKDPLDPAVQRLGTGS